MFTRFSGGGDRFCDPGVEGVVEVERLGMGYTEVCGRGREASGRAGRGLLSEPAVARDLDKLGAEVEDGSCLPVGAV